MADCDQSSSMKRPVLSGVAMKDILSRCYGLRLLKVEEMESYEDCNYHVTTEPEESKAENGETLAEDYNLKMLSAKSSCYKETVEGEVEMVARLVERGVPTPRVVPTLTGDIYTYYNIRETTGACSKHIVRLMEYMPGRTLSSVPLTEGLCYKLGVLTARVTKALQGFWRPGFKGDHRNWNLLDACGLIGILCVISEVDDRILAADILASFECLVLNHAENFQKGIIHNDITGNNVIVSKRAKRDAWDDSYDIAAILDMGDSVESLCMFELAIVMADVALQDCGMKASVSSGYVLAGYLSEITLRTDEKRLMKVCMCARILMILMKSAYSRDLDPDNDYLLTLSGKGWPLLRQFWTEDADSLDHFWSETYSRTKDLAE